ncbi:MAG: hypothetical protein ACC642_04095, partial [Pseudomonadales bacterium]
MSRQSREFKSQRPLPGCGNRWSAAGLPPRRCRPGAGEAGVKSMFAVFSSGGKQHRVTEGEVIKLER